jgi:hypothetical protein
LRVFRQIVKGMILYLAELMKVFMFIIFVLNATDKFSNPTGSIIALIGLQMFFLNTGVITVDLILSYGVELCGIGSVTVP